MLCYDLLDSELPAVCRLFGAKYLANLNLQHLSLWVSLLVQTFRVSSKGSQWALLMWYYKWDQL